MRQIADLLTKRNCYTEVNQGILASIQFNNRQKQVFSFKYSLTLFRKFKNVVIAQNFK